MRLAYVLVGVATAIATIGLPVISPSDDGRCLAQRFGTPNFGWAFLVRVAVLGASVLVYLYVVWSPRCEEQWQAKVFARFRYIAVRELLHGTLVPAGFEGRRLDDARTWSDLYGNAEPDAKAVTISALRGILDEYPDMKETVDELARLWNVPQRIAKKSLLRKLGINKSVSYGTG